MKPSQLTVVFSNLEAAATVLVLEEMAVTAQDQELFLPMLLSPASGYAFHAGEWEHGSAHPWRKAVKRALWSSVPFLQADQWGHVLAAAKSKDAAEILNKTKYFLPVHETSVTKLPSAVPSVLFLLKPDSGAASFLYKLLNKMLVSWPGLKNCQAVVYGVPHIEAAALEFERLQREVSGIMDKEFRLDFLSHAAPTEEKLQAARYPNGGSLVRAFPEDAFHGQMKKLAKGLRGSSEGKPEGETAPLVAWAADI